MSLPTELLCEIFLRACGEQWASESDRRSYLSRPSQNRHQNSSIRRRAVRAAISGTCHRWRDIANDTPLLWTDITIDANRALSQTRDGLLLSWADRVETELSRASTAPLSLRFMGTRRRLDAHSLEIWDQLFSAISRCRAFCLEVSWQVFNHFPVFSPEYLGQQLVVLSISISISIDHPPPQAVDLTSCTNLESLHINNEDAHLRLVVKVPSTTKITSLSLEGNMPFANAVDVIKSCPLLESLRWRTVVAAALAARTLIVSSLSLPTVRALTLGGSLSRLVPAVAAAAGEVESLKLRHSPHYWNADAQFRPSLNHFPSLRHLVLGERGWEFTPTLHVATFLLAHPLLEVVYLHCDIDPILADCLALSEPGERVLPNLRRFGVYQAPPRVVRSILETRMIAGARKGPSSVWKNRWGLSGPDHFVLELHPNNLDPDDLSDFGDYVGEWGNDGKSDYEPPLYEYWV